MEDRFSRTELLLGPEAVERLGKAHVAVFGLGGVGGYVVEALARCGIGALDLIDHDTISESNLNRQILATVETIGKAKADVAAARVRSIAPECQVQAFKTLYLPDTAGQFDFAQYDYIVDAIDTVTAKLLLAEQAQAAGTPIIASMGTGNKLDPTAFRVADIYETSICPLARIMRKECRKRGIEHLKVVYSEEEPQEPQEIICEGSRRALPGSVSFVPSAAGLIIAGEVIKDLIRE